MNWRTVLMLTMLAPVAGESQAQGVATSLDEVVRSHSLERGHVIHVTDDSGRRVKGRVGSLSSDSLTLSAKWGTSTFDAEHIVRIERHDSPWSGFNIGFWGVMMTSALLGIEFERPETALMYIGAIAGGAGLVGGVVDAQNREPVYERPRTRWSLAPLVTKRGAGARMSVGW